MPLARYASADLVFPPTREGKYSYLTPGMLYGTPPRKGRTGPDIRRAGRHRPTGPVVPQAAPLRRDQLRAIAGATAKN